MTNLQDPERGRARRQRFAIKCFGFVSDLGFPERHRATDVRSVELSCFELPSCRL
jgi:hypothetical protein